MRCRRPHSATIITGDRPTCALAHQARDPDIRTTLEAMADSYDTLVAESDRIDHLRTRISIA